MITTEIVALEKKLLSKIETSRSSKLDTTIVTKIDGPDISLQAKIDAVDTRFK